MSLSSRMPDLRALDALLAVARHGTQHAAAAELGISQQAVSARLTALERQTGVRLVTRTTHGSTLTSAGVVAVQWADNLMAAAHEIDAGLASLREDSRARLTVSASLTIAEQLFPRWLVSLQAEARRQGRQPPEVVLIATNSDHVVAQVRAGTAALGFVEGASRPRGLRSRVVAHDELVLIVHPEHRWAGRDAVSAAELSRTPLVTRERGSGTRESLDTALRRALGGTNEPAPPQLELSTASSVRAAVVAGAAPAVMSRLAVADDVAAGRLSTVRVTGVDLHRSLRAIWSGARTPPAGAVRDLLTHIVASGRVAR